MTKIKQIKIPDALPKMGTWFDIHLQDLWEPGHNMIDYALTHVDHAEMREIRDCIKEALAAPFTAKQLQGFWRCLDPEFNFREEKDLRSFLSDIVHAIDRIVDPE
jgi:hypothetical protein